MNFEQKHQRGRIFEIVSFKSREIVVAVPFFFFFFFFFGYIHIREKREGKGIENER